MNSRTFSAAALALALAGATAAQAAEPGYTTADVNIRTGPDIEFPVIDVIPEGDDIYVEGCLRDESWCDVRWDGFRGWVYSEYLAIDYRGDVVLLPDVGLSAFSIPIIAFSATRYWNRHYIGRPWYKDRRRWFDYQVRPRHGWRAPPRGDRKRGWWRSEYNVPRGMKAPPPRNWKRPARAERRRDLRDNRRDDRRPRVYRRGDDTPRGNVRPDNNRRPNTVRRGGDGPRGEIRRNNGQPQNVRRGGDDAPRGVYRRDNPSPQDGQSGNGGRRGEVRRNGGPPQTGRSGERGNDNDGSRNIFRQRVRGNAE